MSDRTVKITRKGKVTIPAKRRRKHMIREGMQVLAREAPRGLLVTPPLEDLAGIDAGIMTLRFERLCKLVLLNRTPLLTISLKDGTALKI